MGSTAVPLRLIPGGAPGAPPSSPHRASSTPRPSVQPLAFPAPASRRRPAPAGPPERVVDLGARRRATQLPEIRAILELVDGLWSSLWRAYPGRERDVVELHLRFDAVRDGTMAWLMGLVDHAPHAQVAAQLEGAAILGAPDREPATWRSLCRMLEDLEHRLRALDPAPVAP